MIIYRFKYLNTSLFNGISKMISLIIDIHLWRFVNILDIHVLLNLFDGYPNPVPVDIKKF